MTTSKSSEQIESNKTFVESDSEGQREVSHEETRTSGTEEGILTDNALIYYDNMTGIEKVEPRTVCKRCLAFIHFDGRIRGHSGRCIPLEGLQGLNAHQCDVNKIWRKEEQNGQASI